MLTNARLLSDKPTSCCSDPTSIKHAANAVLQAAAPADLPRSKAYGARTEPARTDASSEARCAPAVAQDSGHSEGRALMAHRQPPDEQQPVESAERERGGAGAVLAAHGGEAAQSQASAATTQQLPPLPGVQPSHSAEAEESWQNAAQVSTYGHAAQCAAEANGTAVGKNEAGGVFEAAAPVLKGIMTAPFCGKVRQAPPSTRIHEGFQ